MHQQREQLRAASRQAEAINRGVEQASALSGVHALATSTELLPCPPKLQALAHGCCLCSTDMPSPCLADMLLTLWADVQTQL